MGTPAVDASILVEFNVPAEDISQRTRLEEIDEA